MRHILLRFNYGVEIGARLAYLGHHKATGNLEILKIADEELEHRNTCERILRSYGKSPWIVFNMFFTIVGTLINRLCAISPNLLMDFIARTMELFAFFNYSQLAKLYPEHRTAFEVMSLAEKRHEIYFKERL